MATGAIINSKPVKKYPEAKYTSVVKKSRSGVSHTKYILSLPNFSGKLNHDGRRADDKSYREEESEDKKRQARDLQLSRQYHRREQLEKRMDINRKKSAQRRADKKNENENN